MQLTEFPLRSFYIANPIIDDFIQGRSVKPTLLQTLDSNIVVLA